ncbi:MAG: hypothetical protein ABIK73_06770 [candidate division WOR-3 bacterium]
MNDDRVVRSVKQELRRLGYMVFLLVVSLLGVLLGNGAGLFFRTTLKWSFAIIFTHFTWNSLFGGYIDTKEALHNAPDNKFLGIAILRALFYAGCLISFSLML